MTRTTDAFDKLNERIINVKHRISASAVATYILVNGEVVNEWHAGYHHDQMDSRPVDKESQFNVASIRKTYLGFAVSLALYEGEINSFDDYITQYVEERNKEIICHSTIRHWLTHMYGIATTHHRIFEQALSIISPNCLKHDLPRHGFFWFVQDTPRSLSELGDRLPSGSFQFNH